MEFVKFYRTIGRGTVIEFYEFVKFVAVTPEGYEVDEEFKCVNAILLPSKFPLIEVNL